MSSTPSSLEARMKSKTPGTTSLSGEDNEHLFWALDLGRKLSHGTYRTLSNIRRYLLSWGLQKLRNVLEDFYYPNSSNKAKNNMMWDTFLVSPSPQR